MLQNKNINFTAVMIGGNAAGLSAASKLKRLCPSARVLVFEKSPDVSYSSCGIPFWLEGVVDSAEMLLQLSPRSLRENRHIEVFPRHAVLAIDRRQKRITVQNMVTDREFSVPYDKLLLATGASPILPAWPGNQANNIFTVRSLSDARKLHDALKHDVRRIAIIGAGYVGLEIAAALHHRNYEVTLLEKAGRLLSAYHESISEKVSEFLRKQGIKLHCGVEVVEFETTSDNRATALLTAALPPRIEADLYIISVGIQPNVALAQMAGLRLGATGAIATDETLRTNYPDIFAAGDCIEITHQLTGEKVWLPLGPAANKQGRIAGENMAGGHQKYWGAIGTAVFKTFDLEVARTGLTASEAEKHFGVVKTTTIHANDIAGYLPGEKSVCVVLIYHRRSGQLLGAEMAGYHGIGKRIDVLATALAAKMTVSDLTRLDLSYAPHVAPVWDPILVAANVAAKS